MERKIPNVCRLGRHVLSGIGAVFAVAALAACAAPSGVADFGALGCKQISKRAEAKINWARVPEVELVIRDGDYSPMVTRLRQGRPYILRIRNRDDGLRTFSARRFFDQNAVIAIGLEGVRAEETCVASISIPSRQSAEVRFVAITDGTFEYEDTFFNIPLVFSGGPGGVIVIDERRETAGIN